MNNWFKRNGIHFAIIAIFFGICFFYLTPSFQGKTFGQNDVTRAQSTQKEIMDYRAKDTTILWTNQVLGGMPTFQLWASYPYNITTAIFRYVKAVFPDPVAIMLILMGGAYFLFCVLKLNPWLAAAGAIAVAFSSYNIIYIVAGHTNQAYAIAFFAPIIAGILLTLRGNYLTGASLTALFLALEIRANHIQMTYYLLLAILILVFIELYNAVKKKTTKPFLKSLAYLGGAALLAIAVNASILWSTYEYGKDTIRGKSNLTQHTTEPSNGLPKDYAYAWSQGVGESFTFLIPNVYGGGTSTPLMEDSHVVKALTDKGVDANQAQQFAQQLPYYWGEKSFTEGPWYFGAAICFLFVLGLLIVKDRIKWWLLGAVILSILLSFGKNLTFVSDLFFDYFPLYNKFRAVESILVIASLCIPVLALLAIREVINTKDKAPLLKKLLLAFYIVGGLTLIIAFVPGLFFSFKPGNNQFLVDQLTQAFRGDSGAANSISNALVQDRESLARSDAFRSLLLIVIAFGLLWAFIKQKINVTVLSVAFLVITLFDMWQVDKRYLNDNSYTEAENIGPPKPREIDQFIQRDTDPDFRVIDLSKGDPRSDGISPFFYKSIGGYSAARLKRYDELIESQLTKSVNHDVLDMLNTKYIITADPKTQEVSMQANKTACGHAWFVKSVKYADNADQEMQAITTFDPKNVAIVDKQYRSLINEKQLAIDTNATIKLVHYNPDHMIYQSGSTTSQIAVFSEIYYDKGWKMLVDGQEQPYFRADYLLRAAQLPVGNHKVEFIFHPASYYVGEDISLAASILLVVALGGAAYAESRKQKPAGKKG
ncbi:MAG: hypothetical protein JWR67_1123 [Mucilaginibacter sp.]|nr:hypothetical protein [Mucilaginibacter sp.]